VAAAADQPELDRATLDQWMVGLNAVRLVLGTVLDVSEDGYPDLDPEAQAEFELLVGDELVASRLAAIDQVEATLDAQELTDEDLLAWMQALNAVRLVLGTILDVSEDDSGYEVDDDDPDAGTWALYGYLSFLLDQLVDAASP
jgi:hypothetical protein